jgi:hypothetical protein
MKRVRAIVVFAGCLVCLATQAFAQEDDSTVSEIEQRKQINNQAAESLRAENFADLEKTAQDLRTNKSRLPSGLWKLYYFYKGIESPADGATGNEWMAHLARLEKWRAQYPESITVHTVLAGAYVNYAWQARGGGYANSVTEEGWDLFRERIHKAEEYVLAGRKLSPTDPQLDLEDLVIGGKGLNWNREQYNAVFNDAIRREPLYEPLYFQKEEYLLPRWSGKRGDVEQFALQAMQLTQDAEGKAMYARLAGHLRRYLDENTWFFEQYRFSWPDVREGFQDLEKQYPHSLWNLNLYCWMACHAKDGKTAHELFERIGDHWDGDIWGNEGAYRTWKKWAENPSVHSSGSQENAEEAPLWRRLLRYLLSW